jgi:lipopolysaccharide/colanic/teichoic acid biosynthesis glycosyltransferase
MSMPVGHRVHVATERRARWAYHTAKRILDVVVAATLLLLLSPLLVVIALAIRLEGPGPIVFHQERVRGHQRRDQGGRAWELDTFTMLKFRTMRVEADDELHRRYIAAYLAGDEAAMAALRPTASDNTYKLTGDPRVTRVGGVLRSVSLDELPQLWNIVRGDMSLVGPRPPLPYEVVEYQEHHLQRLAARPGLTGWWQVNGRCETTFEEMVELDLEYLTRRSLWLDVVILLKTIPTALSGRGAG